MQIKRMPACFIKLANYADRHNTKEPYLQKYVLIVNAWDQLSEEKVTMKTKQKFVGISRATYFRYKKALKNIRNGIFPNIKRPKTFRCSKIPVELKEKVLQIRR